MWRAKDRVLPTLGLELDTLLCCCAPLMTIDCGLHHTNTEFSLEHMCREKGICSPSRPSPLQLFSYNYVSTRRWWVRLSCAD